MMKPRIWYKLLNMRFLICVTYTKLIKIKVKRLIINFIVQISSGQMRFCLITAKAPGSFAVTQAACKRGGVESEHNR